MPPQGLSRWPTTSSAGETEDHAPFPPAFQFSPEVIRKDVDRAPGENAKVEGRDRLTGEAPEQKVTDPSA